MELYFRAGSPQARVARVFWREKDLRVVRESPLLASGAAPSALAHELPACTPLLVDDDLLLIDARLVCEYFDAASGSRPLIPSSGDARWCALQAYALAGVLMQTAGALERERASAPEPSRAARQSLHIRRSRTLAAMEQHLPALLRISQPLTIGHIAFAVALADVDAREPHLGWPRQHGELGAWHRAFCARTSMQATAPAS